MTEETIVELPEPKVDPDNPAWMILPVQRGVSDEFVKLWDVLKEHGAHVIGGWVRWMISPDFNTSVPSDIDVFMDEQPDPAGRCAQLREALKDLYSQCNVGPLSWYYYNEKTAEEDQGLSVNLVVPRLGEYMRTFGTIYEILGMFDFTVVRCGLKSLTEAVADVDFLEDERRKVLYWKHINCPLAGIFRLLKYTAKGYHAGPREVAKLLYEWDVRPPEYKAQLKNALEEDEPTEEEIMRLEHLLWVD